MIPGGCSIFTCAAGRILAATVLCAVAALAVGCKNDTRAASLNEHTIGKPPILTIAPVQTPIPLSNPLTSNVWNKAAWTSLAAPANTMRTTAPVRAAVLLSSTTLYAAFVCEKQPVDVTRDAVSLYLDTRVPGTDDKTEMVKIVVDSTGTSSSTWIRSDTVPTPRPDASPDMGFGFVTIPDFAIEGMKAQVSQASEQGAQVWTAALAIPLLKLPLPLKTSAASGAHWRINLLRNVTVLNGNGEREQLQVNLSPIYVGAQEFTTWRMADLIVP